ncbi:MAG: DUF3822 family protein [Sphingobacteriales bacterium]|nr:MAG: DUF3822 family protein [Sphingobacteriales bacterium]TAF81293.1 MAG: DUF3822 family protein [Sphingobacteriales bacterium]
MGYKIYASDGNFNTVNTLNYLLFIEVGQDFYSYIIVDEGGKIKAISYCEQSIFGDIDNSLLQLTYKKTAISLYTSSFTFIPSQIYSKDDETVYAQFLETKGNTNLYTHTLLNDEIRALHTFATDEFNAIKSIFPLAEIFPQYFSLINCGYKQLGSEISPQLLLNIKLGCVEILILQNNKLLFYNVFDTGNDDEILYYTLAACQQNGLEVKGIKLHVCGNVELDSNIYNLLKQYFGKVHFRHHAAVNMDADAFGNIIKHQFYSVLSLSACV